MVGAPLETAEQAVGTLLASEDGWLRSCAVHAVGGLRLHGLESELQRFENSPDPGCAKPHRPPVSGSPAIPRHCRSRRPRRLK